MVRVFFSKDERVCVSYFSRRRREDDERVLCAFATDRLRGTGEDVRERVQRRREGVVLVGEGSEGRLDRGREQVSARGRRKGGDGGSAGASGAGEVDDGEQREGKEGGQAVVGDPSAVAQVEDAQVDERRGHGVEGGGGGIEGSQARGVGEQGGREQAGVGEGEHGEVAMGADGADTGQKGAERAGDVGEEADDDSPRVDVELNAELTPPEPRPRHLMHLVRIRRNGEHTQSDKRRDNHHNSPFPTASFFFRCHVPQPTPLSPAQARLSLQR